VKSLLVRREKAKVVREELISRKIEFYEERDGFHFLFIFPVMRDEIGLNGKWSYLVGDEIDEVEIKKGTFKIDGSKEVIDLFAPKFEKRGLNVKMDEPDNLIEIKKWGKKYLISVS
jgi:hypothetical protein